ncbi:hypothetical protein BS17DRAFT_823161 [Gyrodon lividus]|nr:hypothetical protein BS17DRAFT_823161 [Gyrodon lividus]
MPIQRADTTDAKDASPDLLFHSRKPVSKLFALPRPFSCSSSIPPVNDEFD